MINNLPNGWEIEKLGNISDIKAGGTPSRSKNEYWTGNIPWLKISDLKTKYIYQSTEFITEEGLNNSSTKLFEKDTILYTIFATLGEVSILKSEATTNQAIAGIKLNKSNIDLEFIYYFLLSIKEKILNVGRGVAQNNINLSILRDLNIPIPPLQQQEKIVKVLDLTSNLIEKQKELLGKYDLFLKSKFIEMFGTIKDNPNNFNIEPIKNFGRIITGNTPSRQEEEFYNDNFIEWIKTDNIHTNQQYVSTASEYLSEIGMKKGRILEKGGLLITCIAGSLKSIGNVAMTDRKITFNQQINAIQPFENVDSLFLFWQLKINKNYVQTFSTSSMKKIITKGEFQEIEFLKPPFELQ